MHRNLASGPIVWLGIIIATCLLLVLFQTVLWLVLPVLLAVVAYYLLSPLVSAAMARGMTRTRAVLIVTVLLTICLALIGLIFVPKIVRASNDWRAKVADYAQSGINLVAKLETTLSKSIPFMHRAASPELTPDDQAAPIPEAPAQPADDEKTENATAASALNDKIAAYTDKYSGDIALELAHWIPSLLLVPYITYFFLLDGPRFKRFLVQAIPNAFFEKTLYLFYRVEDQLRRYFQGLLALTALDAFCLGTGLWFMGLNAPFMFAIVAAVMAWLPYLGSIAGGLLVVLVAAHDFPNATYLPYEVVALFIGVRLLDDFVFMPLTVGRSLHMHPLVTVLMILLGGAVAGISGLLLVMPVLGVVMVAGQIIGELVTDERILARHRHAQRLRRQRARADLFEE